MATFQPAPTWAPVTVTDPLTGEDSFNPVWLKWFIDVASFITSNGGGGAIDLTTVSGIVARIAASTYAARVITGTAAQVGVTNGDGVAGDPTVDIAPHLAATNPHPQYVGIGKNALINGNFDIWQRATSQTSNGYGSDDRWENDNIGSTKTTSRQTFTLGQTDVPYEPTYYSRTVVTSVAGAGNRVTKNQHIESVQTFAGQTITLSFYAKADASKNIAIEFAQVFGTGGAPSAAVTGIGVTTIALTTSWQKFTVTVAISSISGKTLGTNNDHYLQLAFWFDAGSSFNSRTNSLGQQSGTFDIAQVQLESGSIATIFERRSLGTELVLCQRYYEKSFPFATPPAQNLGTVASGAFRYAAPLAGVAPEYSPFVFFRVSKRASPVVIIYNPSAANAQIRDSVAGADCSATNATAMENGMYLACFGAATTAVGNALDAAWTANAEL